MCSKHFVLSAVVHVAHNQDMKGLRNIEKVGRLLTLGSHLATDLLVSRAKCSRRWIRSWSGSTQGSLDA